MKALVKLAVGIAIVIGSQVVKADSDIEKIIGKNDLIAVDATASNVPAKFRPLVDAFGKLGMGCTATHIGDGYVLTAGHCFWADESAIEDQDCAGAENEIQWGLREGKEPYLVSQCEKIVMAQKTDKMDYALLKVSPVPPVFVKADWSKRAKVGSKVTIFSHPDELPLRWSQLCKIQKVADTHFSQALIHHICDTNPGSSGATIIDAYTLKVVGIHDGGRADSNGGGLNYGTYIYDTPLRKLLSTLNIYKPKP
ncbi:MAG: serine protease [Bdellovibrionota bacterium]